MTWENKVKMVQLGNNRDVSREAKENLEKFIIENIDDFDLQSWDMFSEIVDIVPDEMKRSIDFWRVVYDKLSKININEIHGFRTKLRLAMILGICEDELFAKQE